MAGDNLVDPCRDLTKTVPLPLKYLEGVMAPSPSFEFDWIKWIRIRWSGRGKLNVRNGPRYNHVTFSKLCILNRIPLLPFPKFTKGIKITNHVHSPISSYYRIEFPWRTSPCPCHYSLPPSSLSAKRPRQRRRYAFGNNPSWTKWQGMSLQTV